MNRGNFQELVGKTIKSVDATAVNQLRLRMMDNYEYVIDADVINQIPAITIQGFPAVDPLLARLTEDLSSRQMLELMNWLVAERLVIMPSHISYWRKSNGLPVVPED